MILITGATGLVGTHLLIALIQKENQLRALYRTEAKKQQCKDIFLDYCPQDTRHLFDSIEWVQGDITDTPSLEEVFIGVTYVYHCAAFISFNPSDEKKLRKINIEGTANIVNQCLFNRVDKLCYVSSIAAIGETIGEQEIDETAEWNPETDNSVYAITKYGAEMEVWRGTQEGLDAVIVNPGVIIGAGFFNAGSGFLFTSIDQGLSYYTTGATGYVAIQDVVNIMLLLMKSQVINERYILIGENIDFKTVFSWIANALDKPIPHKKASPFMMKLAFYSQWIRYQIFRNKRIIFRTSIRSAFSDTKYNNDKIKKELNYNFFSVHEAIKETASYFLKQN